MHNSLLFNISKKCQFCQNCTYDYITLIRQARGGKNKKKPANNNFKNVLQLWQECERPETKTRKNSMKLGKNAKKQKQKQKQNKKKPKNKKKTWNFGTRTFSKKRKSPENRDSQTRFYQKIECVGSISQIINPVLKNIFCISQ